MKTVFLMIARVLYDKGYQEYVDAARIIRQEHPDVEFWLLGKIDEEYPNHVPGSVVDADHSAGIICYKGFTPDVKPIEKEADCIVLPSYHEGLSRVLIEALAMHKPIITTDISGCKETVEDGRNGYLVPPRNVDALVKAIRKFLNLYSSYMTMDEQKTVTGVVVCMNRIDYASMKRDDGIGCLTAMYDTAKVGKMYMSSIRKRQDWGLWLEILAKCKVAYGVKEPLAYYRVRSGSISNKKLALVKHNINVYRTILKFSAVKAYLFFCFVFIPSYLLKKFRVKLNSL